MTTGMVQDQNLEKQIEKQMGCMAGFLHIFDRHQILAGKRLYSTKRLPPSVGNSTPPPPENSVSLPEATVELEKLQQTRTMPSPDRVKHFAPVTELRSPAPEPATPVQTKPKQTLPLPVFEYKEGNRSLWKFSREAPRLSLDSRAIVDGKGSIYPREIRTNASILSANRSETSTEEGDEQRRSPSVIARLMGLEPLPNSEPELIKNAELRRSASESRVSKDFYHSRFIDGNNFRLKQSQHSSSQDNNGSNVLLKNAANMDHSSNVKMLDRNDFAARSTKVEPIRSQRGLGPRKIFFDSGDVFPEPKQPASIYGEIEKRLKMRGIDEPSKDLETLKQILEALQLKGLLHSKKSPSQRKLVYDRISSQAESPIVVMRPARSPTSVNRLGRISNDSPPSSYRARQIGRRNVNVIGDSMPSVTTRRDRLEFDRNLRNQPRNRFSSSPTRCENNVKSPSRRGLFVETQRRINDPVDQRRNSKINSSKFGSDPQMSNRSPKNRKPMGSVHHPKERKIYISQAEDESSTFSESSISNSSQTDTERSNKIEEYKEGRTLLERCGKLLHSIAEITATELQPSPVSVLDSSFYKEESSPSPVLKRQIDFKGQVVDVEDEGWFQAISLMESGLADGSDDGDFVYVMDVLRASRCLQDDDSDIFLLLEEQQYLKGKDVSKVPRLQRRLIFDTITEILDRNRQLPPWKSNAQPESMTEPTSVQEIWSEFQRMRDRENNTSGDLFEVICSVLKKDLTRDAPSGWRDWPVETSQAVLDIERLIFKDLIGETIRDLAAITGKCNLNNTINMMPRRKLVF
ncbi:protein LONGIFOLIA 1 [Cucumis melo var. makuwa]|uniref:Protein LONGIFOLIA 1 n=2 Tax=Cucumis melo TaxID=3656 RepID=A0A5D3E2T5_CUCMM|nr:protein LONGIFOLIA 1 [Cucumis melo var. makuwa]TYK30108.1 protein LONGIFOLIA 1 [Cucumis melo var. makuwa]